MSNYHKPRTFRSHHGCCICRAKSSSSRFTDSDKYEEDFTSCFKVDSDRSGDICNACVLLVKRWKKLPRGSKKNWSHVVDARATTGGCQKAITTSAKQKIKSLREDPDLKAKKIIKKRPVSTPSYHPPEQDNVEPVFCTSPDPSEASDHSTNNSSDLSQDVSPFLDLRYWKRTKVCCGVIFLGDNKDLAIDVDLFKPCAAHRSRRPPTSTGSMRSRTDTISSHSSSVLPAQPGSPSASNVAATDTTVEIPGSPSASNVTATDTTVEIQLGHVKDLGMAPSRAVLEPTTRTTRQTVNIVAS